MRGLSSETEPKTEPRTELLELTKLQAKVIELMDLVMEQGKEISEHQHDLSEADEVNFLQFLDSSIFKGFNVYRVCTHAHMFVF